MPTFNYTGNQQTWVVPSGVGEVEIECWGAEGGRGTVGSTSAIIYGGYGGYAKGRLAVTPGETLYIYVGGRGPESLTNATVGFLSGGYNGGGQGYAGGTYSGGSGGGASDVRQGGTALANRRIVAGGGGGAGDGGSNYSGNRLGGNGGGTNGLPVTQNVGGGLYSQGGTQTQGGAGGYYSSNYPAGNPGSLGNGGNALSNGNGSGGGGAGYYGGGAGTWMAGAGGSGYIGGVTSGTNSTSTRTGDGQVIITVTANAPSTPGVFTSPTTSQIVDASVNATFGASTDPDGGTITYRYEYSLNNGSSWNALTTDTVTTRLISTSAWAETVTAKFRVRAEDSGGLASAWRESPAFEIRHNQPPGQPGAFISPTLNMSVEDLFTASWGAATDNEGNLIGYDLERTTDGTTWVAVGSLGTAGESRLISAETWDASTIAQLRVRARDSGNLVSSWVLSPVFEVFHPAKLNRFDGTIWVAEPLRVWTGTEWVGVPPESVMVWDGTAWRQANA